MASETINISDSSLCDKLGLKNAFAFDLKGACCGFMYALETVASMISSGRYKKAIVIGADKMSSMVDYSDRATCPIFGDGAGAVVLTCADKTEGFLAYRLYTDTRENHFGFTIPAGGVEIPITEDVLSKGLQYFQMDGKAVYNSAISVLPRAITQVLEDTRLAISDINLMIPHQPSIKILKKTSEIIGLPFEKVMTNMDRYANTSSGTIPILLDEVKLDSDILKKLNKIEIINRETGLNMQKFTNAFLVKQIISKR